MSADAGWVMGSNASHPAHDINLVATAVYQNIVVALCLCEDCLKALSSCLPADPAAILCVVQILTLLLSRQLMSSHLLLSK
jgi:hypothetical protein